MDCKQKNENLQSRQKETTAYCTLRNETRNETKQNEKRNETEYFNK